MLGIIGSEVFISVLNIIEKSKFEMFRPDKQKKHVILSQMHNR